MKKTYLKTLQEFGGGVQVSLENSGNHSTETGTLSFHQFVCRVTL